MDFVELGTFEYHLRMFMELFFFYAIFITTYRFEAIKKKVGIMFLAMPLSFLGQIYVEGIAEVISVVLYYYFLKKERENTIVLLNMLVFSANMPYLISTGVSGFILSFPFLDHYSDIQYVTLELFIEMCFIVSLICFLKAIQFDHLLISYASRFSLLLLILNYCLMQLYLYATAYFQIYEQFILATVGLLVVQFFFLFLFFRREIIKQKQVFEERLLREQLQYIRLYTDSLEYNQEKFRKFRHDYKNLLLSLRAAATENRADLVIEQVDLLSEYSGNYFKTTDTYPYDIKNVKNNYLKSLLIGKFFMIEKENIHYRFECMTPIDKISMNIFDLIRIIGVSLDNSIEEAKRVENAEIHVSIYQTKKQIEFIIENSTRNVKIDLLQIMECGYSTKSGHSGIGLSNIEDIKKKYPNVFVQYKSNQNKFTVQLTILDEEE